MSDTVRTVNCMREARLGRRIDLERLHREIPKGKLYRGRPQMLVVPTASGRNLQVFASGVIQIMGNVTHRTSLAMRDELLRHLRRLHPQLPTPTLTLKNLVACAQLTNTVPLHRIKQSSANATYEPELFPALLLRRFAPIHVAVFHTGKCVLTGLQSLDQARDIMNVLSLYLENTSSLC